jgi:hypothetical protein
MRLLALVLVPGVALAESGWLVARGRLLPETRLEAFVGSDTFGAGFVRTDTSNGRAGISFEGVIGFIGRTAELRGARVWQLGATRFATASVSLGGAAFLVPDRRVPEVGLGPHGQLSLTLGGRVFAVDLSLETGAELFFRGGLRLPQRAGLGLHLRIAEFTVALMARAGADLAVGRSFVGRGEVMLAVGWLGLDSALDRPAP